MSDYIPPTDKEVRENRDPKWLREQADLIESQAISIADQLRDRADKIEFGNSVVSLAREKNTIEKLLGAKETAVKNWQRSQN